MLRYRPIHLLLIVVLSCATLSCSSQRGTRPTVHNAPLPANALARQGLTWEQWQKSHAAQSVDAHLRSVLHQAIAGWVQQGVKPESFGVVRSRGHHNEDQTFDCYPFEKRHAPGRAIDLWMNDLNHDGRIDLQDACLFAASLERTLQRVQGACGVYGQATPEGNKLWVHVDVSGKTDRWGEWRTLQGEAQTVVWSSQQRSLRDRCRAWQLSTTRRNIKLVVKKQMSLWVYHMPEQSLTLHPSLQVYVKGLLVKSYPVALGFDPINDKEKRDDYRTPEGEFYICDKNPQSRFHKSLRLSYPNAEDAARGLRSGLINQTIYRAIATAIENGRIPPQNTSLGSDIMLHGGGGVRENWTWGCVALDNEAIDELYDFAPLGTKVEVRPIKWT